MQNIEKVFILLLRIIHAYFGSSHLDLSTLKRLHSIDSSFPSEQFAIDNYKIFRRDRNCFGEGLMFYMNENIPCRELSPEQNDSNFEIIFLLNYTTQSQMGINRPL